MSEWLRFSIAYWHTMNYDGSDVFGAPTKVRELAAAKHFRFLHGTTDMS